MHWTEFSDALLLDLLCEAAGVELAYYDFYGQEVRLKTEHKVALLAGLGFTAQTRAERLAALESYAREYGLSETAIVRRGAQPARVQLRIHAALAGESLTLTLYDDAGESRPTPLTRRIAPAIAPHPPSAYAAAASQSDPLAQKPDDFYRPSTLAELLEFCLDEILPETRRVELTLLETPRPGYYEGALADPAGRMQQRLLWIIAPAHAYSDPDYARKPAAGLMTQLYALKSPRNLGIGDFGDALNLGAGLAGAGVRVLGLSPIHALFPAHPEHRSPYSPSSRFYYNIAHIDLDGTPEWRIALRARGESESAPFESWLENETARDRIDYTNVVARKLRLLELLFEEFYEYDYLNHTVRADAFKKFQATEGERLRLHALYDALYESFLTQGRYGFRQWPAEYARPDAPAVIEFSRRNHKRILFFAYAQWVASEALTRLVAGLSRRSQAILLDLAVGADPGGAEVWSNQRLFAENFSVGAPPDPFAANGQNWGLLPLNPLRLRKDRYRHFIDLLRKNMLVDGLLRIDHVMGLFRTYWIENRAEQPVGAYVRYDFEALSAILALESLRHRNTVIGEDLGNVPDAVRAGMTRDRLLSWKVLYFEREADGAFRPVEQYPRIAVATINTHDLPTLPGWWSGRDLRERLQRGFIQPEDLPRLDYEREQDRHRLVDLFERQQLLDDATRERIRDYDLSAVTDAAHRLLARSGSELALASLHDLLLDLRQPNLPGTVDEYPNWALRYSETVAGILGNARVLDTLRALADRG